PDLSKKIVDMGSGAGFPGMALAIFGATDVHLIESDGKKITFLKEVARSTKTTVYIHHGRIEKTAIPDVKILIARACAPLSELLNYSFPFVSHGTICLFPKGKKYDTELKDASREWTFDHHVTPSVTDTEAVILTLSNIRKAG